MTLPVPVRIDTLKRPRTFTHYFIQINTVNNFIPKNLL
jgi:hypothetical protein